MGRSKTRYILLETSPLRLCLNSVFTIRYLTWSEIKQKISFPAKVFSEITFILTGVRPVIQLRPSGLDKLRVKSFLEKIRQLGHFWFYSTVYHKVAFLKSFSLYFQIKLALNHLLYRQSRYKIVISIVWTKIILQEKILII